MAICTADAASVRLLFRDRLVPLVALVGAGAVVPGASLHFLGHDAAHLGPDVHFVGVGISAVAASLAAVALTVIGVRRRDGRVVLVGTTFTVMAALLAIHGLATPGVVIGQNGVISLTGAATLPVGGAVLALSALPGLRRPRGIRPLLLVLRALKTYLLTRRSSDLAVVVGIGWLTAALPAALLLNYTDLGWWLGHGFELAGIVIVGAAVAADLQRSAQSRPLVGDLRAAELVAEEEAFLGARVRALTQRLHEKDASTEEHTRRVATRAVQVGEALGLPPGRLRALAIGGLLHDIGKLSVPERILKKPAGLDEDEFAVVKRHPEWGLKLLRELGGFASSVHELVHSHHERLDGTGYPRGLRGCDLGLDTRILAVCDVYDALVSPRVYRPAWSHDAAIALLHEETGAAFD